MLKSSFLIAGKHAVTEAIKNPKRKVLRVFLTEESKKNLNSENKDMYLRANSSNIMYISGSGNVGIGTTAPNHTEPNNAGPMLHISGSGGGTTSELLRIQSNESEGAYISFMGDLSGTEYFLGRYDTGDEDKFAIGRQGTAYDFVMDSSGNIGIGNENPPQKLTVGGNISGSGTLNIDGAATIDGQLNITNTKILHNPGSGVAAEFNIRAGSGADAYIIMEADNSEDNVDSWKLQVADGGTFSIYTQGGGSWASILDLTPTSGNAAFAGDVTIDGSLVATEFHTEFISASVVYSSGSNIFGDTQSDQHTFTGSLVVTGSVGIGTANRSAAKLEVHGGVYNNSLLIKSSGDNGGIRFVDSAGNTDGLIYAEGGEIGFLDDDGNWAVRVDTDTSTSLYVNISIKLSSL